MLPGGSLLPLQLAHDELKEQKRSFCGLFIVREVTLNSFFFLAAKRWVGKNDINTLPLTNLRELLSMLSRGSSLSS
jgi:hypothetical protein